MQGAFAVDDNQMRGRNRRFEIHIRRPIVAGGACGQNVQAFALKARPQNPHNPRTAVVLAPGRVVQYDDPRFEIVFRHIGPNPDGDALIT